MATQYKNLFVDERYSAKLEPNLFLDSVLVPQSTYSTRWQGDASAGLVKIHKLTRGSVTAGNAGTDFSHVDVANTVLNLPLDKNFKKSYKIYGVQSAAVQFDTGLEFLNLALREVKEGWNGEGVGQLVDGGKDLEVYTAVTDVHAEMVNTRKVLRDEGARPNTIMAGTGFYAKMLKDDNFIKASQLGDRIQETGAVGQYLGMLVYESNNMPETVEYVMYDSDAFAIATNFEAVRIVDAIDFVGSLAQVEINSGYLVTNPERVAVRLNTDPAA